LKRQLEILTGCPVLQQVLFPDTVSASPLPNWLPLAWLRDATMDAASNDRRSRPTVELILIRLETPLVKQPPKPADLWDEMQEAIIYGKERLNQLPSDFQKDRYFILGALDSNGLLLKQTLPEHRADPELVGAAVAAHPHAGDLIEFVLRHGCRSMLLALLEANGRVLQFASKGHRNDPQLVLAAVNSEGEALQHASLARRQDRTVVLAAVHRAGRALQAAAPHLRDEKEVVLAAVQSDPMALQYASLAMQDDDEVVFLAASCKRKALQFASQRLRSDQNFLKGLRRKKAAHAAALCKTGGRSP